MGWSKVIVERGREKGITGEMYGDLDARIKKFGDNALVMLNCTDGVARRVRAYNLRTMTTMELALIK